MLEDFKNVFDYVRFESNQSFYLKYFTVIERFWSIIIKLIQKWLSYLYVTSGTLT